MACTNEFIDSICSIMAPLGEVRYRKMMDDYIIYLNDKCVATACDNLLYIKMLPVLESLMTHAEIGKPYESAKDHYLLDLSNQVYVRTIITILWDNLPFPKSKKK